MKEKAGRRVSSPKPGLFDFDVPPEADPEKTPALLRYWYLGSKARRYMMLRRVAAVVDLLDVTSPEKVLDVGCDWGLTPAVLARLGFRAVGLDLLDEGFRAARRLSAANGLQFDLVRGDGARLPFRDGAFKAATAVEVLEHVYEPDRERVCAELYRVLAPGGLLALSTPNYGSLVEFAKRLMVKIRFLKHLAPSTHYPTGGVSREKYYPPEYHLPVRRRHLNAMLRGAGFELVRDKKFLFVFKYTPDGLFETARFLEGILERVPLIRGWAATHLLLAVKPAAGSREAESKDGRR
jgi:2-polyprenyl-3-methyl-5-hydroxy-6-metoxy-1,4-benzoquinol methylase